MRNLKGIFLFVKKEERKILKKNILKSCERSKRLPELQSFQGL